VVGSVLVTGGCGMLGSGLVRRLHDDGLAVHSVDRRPTGEPLPGVRYSVADVRDPAAMAVLMAGVDAVVHTVAALPSYPAEQIRSVTVEGTRTVLDAARTAGIERVVHISSTAVYGLPKVVPTPEEHPRTPVDTYGRAKADAEVLAEEMRADGSCVSILRPKTFLGPGRMGLFAMLFEWADEGRNFPVLGRGAARIQMLAMDDLVDAVGAVLRAPVDIANDTYNIAAAEFGTIREDFQAVLDAAGQGRRVVSIPAAPAVVVLDRLERWHLSPVYGRLVHKLLADAYVSIERAHRRLGFTPRYSNRDAILRTYAWWRSERAAAPSFDGASAPSPGRASALSPGRAIAPSSGSGRTSREPWRQGALRLAKTLF
jgi:nucleoside-diphosphate-sugar epimerase